jgi:hypothetical protein
MRLADVFLLCSHSLMEQTDLSRVAETILAAPGWARVGITAPVSHLRAAAAHELARAILEDIGQAPEDRADDQLGLSL